MNVGVPRNNQVYPDTAGYYPPPPPSYAESTQPRQTQVVGVVVVAQPVRIGYQGPIFLETPVHCKCHHCQADIVTELDHEIGSASWCCCCILIAFGCVAGCCLLPFCCKGCKEVVHYCPNCKRVVGRFTRM